MGRLIHIREKKNLYGVWVRKPEERGSLKDLVVDGRIVSKRI